MAIPDPTPILRLIHVDNLYIYLRRGGVYAANFTPQDNLTYRTIYNVEIQQKRRAIRIPCGQGGVIHDYVPFYFGYLSPMLLQLKTGRVAGYAEGQEPLIYLVSTVQAVRDAGEGFVFSDGHGLATFTAWYDTLDDLDQVDWDMINQQYWADNMEDPDRQRRKQAEFLVHRFCEWPLIIGIAVMNETAKKRVEQILSRFPEDLHKPVVLRPNWYY